MKTEVRGAKFDENLKITFLKDDEKNDEWYCCHLKDDVKILIHPATGVVTIYYEKEKGDRRVTVRKSNGSVKLVDID